MTSKWMLLSSKQYFLHTECDTRGFHPVLFSFNFSTSLVCSVQCVDYIVPCVEQCWFLKCSLFSIQFVAYTIDKTLTEQISNNEIPVLVQKKITIEDKGWSGGQENNDWAWQRRLKTFKKLTAQNS